MPGAVGRVARRRADAGNVRASACACSHVRPRARARGESHHPPVLRCFEADMQVRTLKRVKMHIPQCNSHVEQLRAELLELVATQVLGEDVGDVVIGLDPLGVDDGTLHELADLEVAMLYVAS